MKKTYDVDYDLALQSRWLLALPYFTSTAFSKTLFILQLLVKYCLTIACFHNLLSAGTVNKSVVNFSHASNLTAY